MSGQKLDQVLLRPPRLGEDHRFFRPLVRAGHGESPVQSALERFALRVDADPAGERGALLEL